MISVFKFCVIWGIFLTWFADALLFDMMLKTEYRDGVDTIQDLIDRDMTLGTNKRVFQIIVIHIVNLLSVLRPNMEWWVQNMKVSSQESDRILGISKFFVHILIH